MYKKMTASLSLKHPTQSWSLSRVIPTAIRHWSTDSVHQSKTSVSGQWQNYSRSYLWQYAQFTSALVESRHTTFLHAQSAKVQMAPVRFCNELDHIVICYWFLPLSIDPYFQSLISKESLLSWEHRKIPWVITSDCVSFKCALEWLTISLSGYRRWNLGRPISGCWDVRAAQVKSD